MGFCGEMVMRRTPEKGTGGSGEGGTTRGQGNFELAANSGYYSRGSADPRESLRRRRISKLALNAHKVFPAPGCVPSVGWVLTTGRDGVVVCYTFSITL